MWDGKPAWEGVGGGRKRKSCFQARSLRSHLELRDGEGTNQAHDVETQENAEKDKGEAGREFPDQTRVTDTASPPPPPTTLVEVFGSQCSKLL